MTTTPEFAAKTAVIEAYEAIVAAFPECPATACRMVKAGSGVELSGVALSETYAQADTFMAFRLPFNLSGGDIYPMFMRPDLSRRDRAPLGAGFALTNLQRTPTDAPRAVIQVSRRTRGGKFLLQTAPQKIMKVLDWVRTR